MSSFISRFSGKKTSESPAAANSRNYGSVGPIKANSAAIQNQSRNNTSIPTLNNSHMATNMYVIQTEFDGQNNKNKQNNKEQLLTKEIEHLKEQVKDAETNLHINKEIIKNLLDSQNSQGVNNTLQQVLTSLQKENANLQAQAQKAIQQRNDLLHKLQSGDDSHGLTQSQKEKMQSLEKQVSEMKSLLLQKEQAAQQKEQAYNEILQLCVRYSKNDKALMTKLRELKFKHAEGTGVFNNNNSFTTNMTSADDSNENGNQAVSIVQENQQLKKDLDFATSEIERLRSKLIIEDYDMPPLSDELFGVGNNSIQKPSLGRDLSMDNSDRVNNSEFFSNIKEALNQQTTGNNSNSRNAVSRNHTTTSSSFVNGQVPKLDFKRLKKVQEFKDWYSYASKLEDSVKYLRQRIKSLEDDQDQLNGKYRKEQTQKENLYQMNEKLNKALKRANLKITEIKERYKQKISKKCYYCNNDLEISMNLNTTLDNYQITEMNQSFMMMNSGTQGVNDEEDAKEFQLEEGTDNNENLLDNLLIEENNAQTESDKFRQQQQLQQKIQIQRGMVKANQIRRDQDPNQVQKLSRNVISSAQHISAPANINAQFNNKSKYHRPSDKLLQKNPSEKNQL